MGRNIRAAVTAFAVTRLLFFLLLVIGSQIQFVQHAFGGAFWETRIVFDGARVRPETIRMLTVGDAYFYRTLSEKGYPAKGEGPPQSWAFFPLLPLATRYIGPFSDWSLNAAALSHVAFLVGLILLGGVAQNAGYSAEDGERAIFYLACFPTAYFFSMPLTEALFLALSVGAVLAAQRSTWWAAGLLGGLAALTRVTGVLLLVPLVILAWQRRERLRAAWLLLVPAGLASFMLFLWRAAGDPLAFAHVQKEWGRTFTFPLATLLAYPAKWRAVSTAWNLTAFQFAIALLILTAGVALLLRKEWAFGAYALVSIALPLTSGSLQSIGRYALVVFPLFLWLAVLGRNRMADRIITAVSLMLLGWFTALLILRVDFTFA